MKSPTFPRSRAKDRLLLVLTGILVIVIAGAGILIARSHGPDVVAAMQRWVGLGLTTFVVFWYFVGDSRRLWHVRRFWLLSGTLLFLHLLAFGIVLWYVNDWRIVYFIPLNGLEAGLFTAARDRLMLSNLLKRPPPSRTERAD
jgi:hypothetical protein